MKTYRNIVAEPWSDYELLDSGNNKKLERWGDIILTRPETQALWAPHSPELWKRTKAEFHSENGKGSWHDKENIPTSWIIKWQKARMIAKLTSFKHTGIFPEQVPNWQWLTECLQELSKPKILNLFGYTGAVSIIAALEGAEVTHVDASKQSVTWAKENAKISEVSDQLIRYITEDVLKFTKREIRREVVYDGIILDPPAFGRGTQGETWKIEENLSELMPILSKLLLKKEGSFFLLNGYAAGYSPQSFLQLIEGSFKTASPQYGELQIQESKSNRLISSGIYTRFIY